MDDMPDRDEFYLAVARSLAGCQLVEQALKVYITEVLLLVSKRVGGDIPFRMSGEDYEDASLERLIHTFKKLSDNDSLAKELYQFKDKRNFVSHKAISQYLDWEGEVSLTARQWSQLREQLSTVEATATRLELAVLEEANKIICLAFFEPVATTD